MNEVTPREIFSQRMNPKQMAWNFWAQNERRKCEPSGLRNENLTMNQFQCNECGKKTFHLAK